LIKTLLTTTLLLVSLANAKDNNAKFLVVDSKTYEKIEVLNILNGGIEKEFIVSSSKLSKNSLAKYYPEYFIYNGIKCNVINNVQNNTNNINQKVKLLTKENDIKDEVKKIKLLQMLNDINPTNINTSRINKELIKSLGLICGNRLFIRGKSFGQGDSLGNIMIKKINQNNSSISIESK